MKSFYATSVAPALSVAAEAGVSASDAVAAIPEAAGLIVQIVLAVTALIGLFKKAK